MTTLPGGSKQKWERLWTTVAPGQDYGYFVGTTRNADGDGHHVVLYAFGNSVDEIKRFDLPALREEESLTYESIQLCGDTLYLFFSFLDKEAKKSRLMAQPIAAATGQRIGEPQAILTLNETKDKNTSYWNVISPRRAEQGFVIEYRVPTSKKQIDIHYVVLDRQLRVRQEHVVEDVDEDVYSDFRNMRAASSGELYYFTIEEKGDRRRKPRLSDYFIHRVSPDGSRIRQQIQLPENAEAAFPSLRLRSDGTLFVTGKYFDKDVGQYAGLYFAVYDGQTLEQLTAEKLPVAMNEAGLITTSARYGQLDKQARKLFDAYRVDDIFFTDDGAAYVLGESRFTTESVTRAGTPTSSSAYRGLYVTRVNRAGKPVFFRHLPIGVEVYNFPNGILVKDNLLITLYSDRKNMDNLDEPVKTVQGTLSRTLVRHIVVNPQGEASSTGNRYYQKPVPMAKRLETDVVVQSPSGDAVYYYVFDGVRRKALRLSMGE